MGGGGEQSELRVVGVNILKKGVHGGDGFFAATAMIMFLVAVVLFLPHVADANTTEASMVPSTFDVKLKEGAP